MRIRTGSAKPSAELYKIKQALDDLYQGCEESETHDLFFFFSARPRYPGAPVACFSDGTSAEAPVCVISKCVYSTGTSGQRGELHTGLQVRQV